MFDSKWVYKLNKRKNSDIFNEITNLRGISEPSKFFETKLSDINDPFLMNDMKKAVDRINFAIDTGEKICIYGDYDADGLTSTAIMIRFLRRLGSNPGYFIPDRFDDGYGLSITNLEILVQKGYSLVITTDCGINSIKEAEYLSKMNVDLIITDHHKLLGDIPKAEAIICCTRHDNKYPYIGFSGAGVAYILTEAIRRNRNIIETDCILLVLAALGTVADVVALDKENRIIVKEGIKQIKAGICSGIQAILRLSSIPAKNIDTETLGFVIGPRINAAGRLSEAYTALDLLITDDRIDADNLARKLEFLNNRRKKEQETVFKKIIHSIEKSEEIRKASVIIAGGTGYNKGVLGIVASKVKEMYKKTTIIYSIADDKADASGRSAEGYSLIKALEYCDDLLMSYGGHVNAAGLSINVNNIDQLRARLTEFAKKTGWNSKENIIEIDFAVNPKELSIGVADNIEAMEPFGIANSKPVFALKSVVLREVRKIGESKKHLIIVVEAENRKYECLSFNSSFYNLFLYIGEKYDLAFNIGINRYRGATKLQLRLVDIKFEKAAKVDLDILIARLLAHMIKYKKDLNSNSDVEQIAGVLRKHNMSQAAEQLIIRQGISRFNRQDIELVFRKMKNYSRNEIVDIREIFQKYDKKKCILSVESLIELGILNFYPVGLYKYRVINVDTKTKRKLDDSLIFKIMSGDED